MAHVHTHYDNLKVARDAPPEVIRAAYKSLCQKYHPDRHGNSAEAIRIIQIVNSAYSVLSDPVKRREHDDWIARSESQQGSSSDRPSMDSVHIREPGKSRRKSHRAGPAEFLYSRQKPSYRLARSVHRALLAFEDLTKKIFRRT
jgi:DnaJ-class molecular chaperone